MDLNQLNQYVDSTCTVYTDGGEALFPGLIAQCSGTLRINIVYDADTCCPYWTLKPASGIYLRLQDSQDSKKFIMIHGMVINAVNDHFFMLPQDIVFKSNEREYFRQPIQIETTVTIHNGQPVQHACILMDISGGGLCLHTSMEYQVGDLIQIPGQQLYPDGPVPNSSGSSAIFSHCNVPESAPIERQKDAPEANSSGASFFSAVFIKYGHRWRW